MNSYKHFTFTERIKSIYRAIRGIKIMIASQHNAWIHVLSTIAVIIVGFYFGLTSSEWSWIILSIIAVWTAEALNTAFEFLTDVASPNFHPLAEKAKDVAAGAVFIAAMGSFIIGIIIFGPHIMQLAR